MASHIAKHQTLRIAVRGHNKWRLWERATSSNISCLTLCPPCSRGKMCLFSHMKITRLFSPAAACLSAALHHAGFAIEPLHSTSSSESLLPALQCSIEHARFIMVGCKKLVTLLDLSVSSLRRGHGNLLCIVPSLTDDPRRESTC